MILPNQKFNLEIINKRFAHTYFKEKALPCGNVIVFSGELDPGQGYDFSQFGLDYMQEAIHFIYENPLIQDAVSGALFSHFLVSSIANVLSHDFLKTPIAVNMDNMIVNKEFKKKSIIQTQGILNMAKYRLINGCSVGHIAICNVSGDKAPVYTYEMGLNESEVERFSKTLVDMFYKISDAIFLRSCAC